MYNVVQGFMSLNGKTTYCISGFLNKKIITPPVANVEKSTEPDLFGFRQLSS